MRRCLAFLALTALPASAHHSFAAEYGAKALITLTGKIRNVEWSNPHIHIHLEAGGGAKTVTWILEGYPPNTLSRNGFPRERLKQGDTITITAYKAKNGSHTGAGRQITFADGAKLFVGPEGKSR